MGQNRSENVRDHKLVSNLAQNRSENSLTRGGSREAEGGQAQPQETAGSAQAQCYGPAQLAGTNEQARLRGSQSVGAEQSETTAMAAGTAQCDGSTARPRGSREAEGGQAQPQETAGSAQVRCYGPAQLAGTNEQARPEGSQPVVAEQSGTAAMAAGSAQCDGSTTRLGGSREAEGGQAQPQEAAGSAQAQCCGPAQLAGTSEQARPRDGREEQATIGSTANGEVDRNGEGMPGLMD